MCLLSVGVGEGEYAARIGLSYDRELKITIVEAQRLSIRKVRKASKRAKSSNPL